MTSPHSAAARRSLEGLALGDAFGERWFPLFREPRQAYEEVRARRMPEEPDWHWTDDTAMALGILRVLDEHGEIRSTDLAQAFALTYDADPARGCGYGMHDLLPRFLEEPARRPESARGPAMRTDKLAIAYRAALHLAAILSDQRPSARPRARIPY